MLGMHFAIMDFPLPGEPIIISSFPMRVLHFLVLLHQQNRMFFGVHKFSRVLMLGSRLRSLLKKFMTSLIFSAIYFQVVYYKLPALSEAFKTLLLGEGSFGLVEGFHRTSIIKQP